MYKLDKEKNIFTLIKKYIVGAMMNNELEKMVDAQRQKDVDLAKSKINSQSAMSNGINQINNEPKKSNLLKYLVLSLLIISILFILNNLGHILSGNDNKNLKITTYEQALEVVKKTNPHAQMGYNRHEIYGSADEPYEKFPLKTVIKTDNLGNKWNVQYINFDPAMIRLYPLIIGEGIHAATHVPSHKENLIEGQYGTHVVNFIPDTYMVEVNVYIVDADEVKHTLILEQLYPLNLNKYGINKKDLEG